MNVVVNLACQLDGICNPLDESARTFAVCREEPAWSMGLCLLLSGLHRNKSEEKAVMHAHHCFLPSKCIYPVTAVAMHYQTIVSSGPDTD